MINTTNLNLSKPELTDVADITATNPNWDKIDEEITALKSIVCSDTLSVSGWISGSYRWWNDNILNGDQVIELLPGKDITEDQLIALQSANIVEGGQDTGFIKLKAYGEVPTIDIPVTFIIRGDVQC